MYIYMLQAVKCPIFSYIFLFFHHFLYFPVLGQYRFNGFIFLVHFVGCYYFSIMLVQFLSRHSPVSLLRGFENEFPSQNWHWLKVDFFIYYKSCVHHDIAEILLKLVLNTNQSIKSVVYQCKNFEHFKIYYYKNYVWM